MNGESIHLSSVYIAIALLSSLLLVGAWDIWAAYSGHASDSVSNVIGEWSMKFPILPLAVGILAGHLFWPRSLP